MDSEPKLKSILKPSRSSPQITEEEQQRQTALKHAQMIQYQKDVESLILRDLEGLMDLPSARTSDPGNPATEDVVEMRRLLSWFQPSDFDAVVEERNIQEQCGYPLCPRPRKRLTSGAKFKIVRQEGDYAVVPREQLEKWCSDDCARRAMYIRVQLNEEPAWIRPELPADAIKLYENNDTTEEMDGVQYEPKPESLEDRLQTLRIEEPKR